MVALIGRARPAPAYGLKSRASSDEYEDLRQTAVQELARGWKRIQRPNDDFLIVVVTQDPISIESYPTKHTGHVGLLSGLMSYFMMGSQCHAYIKFSCRKNWP